MLFIAVYLQHKHNHTNIIGSYTVITLENVSRKGDCIYLVKLTLKKELKSFNEGSFCPFVFPFFDTTSLHKTTALQFLALFPQIKERDLRYISLEISATVLTFDQNLVIFFNESRE